MYTSSKYNFRHKVVMAMVFLLSFQAGFPLPLSALTSGPTQPEFNEFEPVGTTQMVDLFSGDFTYNIPLFELPGPDGGYPFNLSYHSGITMDQEASWVGLGWNLNHGAITRTMRGFPDDFKGDKISRRMDMKDNRTWQAGINAQIEFLGFEKKTEKSNNTASNNPTNPEPNLSLGLGLKVMHNSYKGWGMGMSFAPNAGLTAHDGFSFSASTSLGVSSFDGASFQPSFSIGNVKNGLGSIHTSLSVNSREGAQNLSLGYSSSYTTTKKIMGQNDKGEEVVLRTEKKESGFNTAPILHSFGKSAYSPQVTMPYRGTNFSGAVEGGLYSGSFIGLGAKVSLSYMKQSLKHRNAWRNVPAYGYFNLQELEALENADNSAIALMDFNREKDGTIGENSSNLANPVSTPDIYSVMGQGTGGLYRAYRSNVGIFTDPVEVSSSGGGRLGVEINGGVGFDVGADLGGNYSISQTKKWEIADGSSLENYQFSEQNGLANFEPYYFKAAGEKTAELKSNYTQWGAEDAVRLKLGTDGDRGDLDPTGILEHDYGSQTTNIGTGVRPDRKPRANAIQSITNEELAGLEGNENLNEYHVEYYTPAANITATQYDKNENSLTNLSRDLVERPHHVAGITSVQANGMRYVYGLPVQNKSQEEIVFSVEKEDKVNGCYPRTIEDKYTILSGGADVKYDIESTDQYLDHNVIPQYTHAYLLTAVLGADYIDLDDIPGPSDGDYGYWVKFTYIKTSDDYRWRTPFHGANYMPGKRSIASDDKASVLFGTREQYYLATAETKTHLAEFLLTERGDGKGAKTRHQKNVSDVSNNYTGASFKLDRIKLYSKLERFPNGVFNSNAVPIKQIKFNSSETLCQGVKNHGSNSGSTYAGAKLSLDSIQFTYENNTRGMLSPYEFEYAYNPGYNDLEYDRWGTYRATNDNNCDALNYPYTYQNETQEIMDRNAAAWHLNRIHLPSGATINVDYEADDYAYVQDRTAMQMFAIDRIGPNGSHSLNTNSKQDDNNPLTDDDLRVFFKLEDNDDDIESYIEDLHGVTRNANDEFDFSESQIYFKILVDLNNSGDVNNNENFEYVSGYAKIADDHSAGNPAYGLDGQGNGFIRLAPIPLGDENDPEEFHPFSVAAWQFLKIEYPAAIRPGVDIGEQYDEDNFMDAIGELLEAFGEMGKLFTKYYRYCSKHEFGDEITLNRSFIRLNTPDKKKYGGDSRVKRVTLIDYWDEDGDGLVEDGNGTLLETPTYGQVYEYTTLDEEGNTISSGVAANEPSIGYEECALRYAKEWEYSATLKSEENLFYEYPINETYYPGASVGYSKVTVKSLATHLAQSGESAAELPNGFGTTGLTVNEFYTAKDFPVLVKETPLDKQFIGPKIIPVFPLYHETNDRFTGSQGYAIVLNDMHGKPHKVSHYGMDGAGNVINQKLSEVVYTYATGEELVYTAAGKSRKAQILNNEVDVLKSDHSSQANAVIEKQLLGVDYEFFVDMRERSSFAAEESFGINVDFTPALLFGLGGVPNLNVNNGRTRTAVTNKIIRKSGILLKTDAYDGQSHITTTNKVFDPMTGEALLTTVNNSFDNPIYNYNIPARYAYERMGPAYKNLGMKFRAKLLADETCGLFKMQVYSGDAKDFLVEGDECLVTGFWSAQTCADLEGLCDNPRFVYVGKRNGEYLFENDDLEDEYYNAAIELMITRSGKRNHLSAKAGSITALADPTQGRQWTTESVNVPRPTGVAENDTDLIDNMSKRSLSQVLNASAVTYSDRWDLGREVVQDTFYVPSPGSTCNCLYVLLETVEPLTNLCDGTTLSYTVDGTPTLYTFDFNAPPNYCFNLFPNTFGYCFEIACTTGEIEDNVTVDWGSNPSGCVSGVPTQHIIAPPNFTTSNCGGGSGGGSLTEVIKAESVYSIGEKGIWRPQRNYAYVTKRTPNDAASNSPDLENDGVYEAFTMFNWDHPFFPFSDGAQDWRKTNEITKYANNGEEVENRDIIGLYSAALYGYQDNLPIAVGANAAYPELAFDGFEEYPTGALTNGNLTENGNLDFECLAENKILNLTYNIVGGYNGGNYIWIDKTFHSGMMTDLETAYLILKDEAGNEHEAAAPVTTASSIDPEDIPLDLPFREALTILTLGPRTGCTLTPGITYTGQVILQWELDFAGETNCDVEISNAFAHTGKQSLKVNEDVAFVQKSLQLQNNQNYVFSAWVSLGDGAPRFTLDDGNIGVDLEFNNTVIASLSPSGEVINGWQRIEGVFAPGNNDFVLRFKSTEGATYFDDIRIYPEDGSAQTYVYDPQNYRLTAVLDNNNYATFYHYDAEGNLFLVKKETARGVKTIQETREYVKAN